MRDKAASSLIHRTIDGVLVGGLALTVLLLGGRSPWAEAALLATAMTGAILVAIDAILSRRSVHLGGAEWVLLGGVLLGVVQLCPLPVGWLHVLSPQRDQFLPAWQTPETASMLGEWHVISLTPQETRLGLGLWIAYSLLFVTVVYRVRRIEHVERYLRSIALGIVAVAVFGLLQYLFANGKFFWIYEHPFAHTRDAVKGSFVNRNHFAEFVALGIGPLLWWLLFRRPADRAKRSHSTGGFATSSGVEQNVLCWMALPVVVVALLLSFSRGGITASLVAALVAGGVLAGGGNVRGRWIGIVLIGLAVVAPAIAIVGPQTVTARWEGVFRLQWSEIDSAQARTHVWQNTWRAARDFWIAGSGIGSFSVVHPHYQSARYSAHYYTHAENGFLQILLETGLPGFLLLLAGLILLGRWTWIAVAQASDSRHRTAAAVVAAGLLAFTLHGLVDYVWYNPALAGVVSVLAGCLARLAQIAPACAEVSQTRFSELSSFAEPAQIGKSRTVVPAFALSLAVMLSLPVEVPLVTERYKAGFAELAWHRYLILYRQVGDVEELFQGETNMTTVQNWEMCELAGKNALAESTPSSDDQQDEDVENSEQTDAATSVSFVETQSSPEAIAGQFKEAAEKEREMIRYLQDVVRYDPKRSEAHLRLAKAYLRLFHLKQLYSANPMPLSQIRDAALHAGFASVEELRSWLRAAFGDHVELLDRASEESLIACRLCPLQAEAYFILGQTSFLRGESEGTLLTWYKQALAVRPNDGDLLFRIGAELAFMGRLEHGFVLWRKAFACGPWYRDRLLRFLVGRSPPELLDQEIAFLLDTFEPDLESLRLMYRLYRKRYPPEMLTRLQRTYALALRAALSRDEVPAEERSSLWLEAYFLFQDAGNEEQAIACAREAVRANPVSYRARYYLAISLEKAGMYAEAEEHLRWCVQRRPGHRALQKRLQDVASKRLEEEQLARVPGGHAASSGVSVTNR
ncbi:O-antigen ligase family protein [Thermogutta sp.]|uniref:O-antigen ligase family protein n=1 Tax=Thermogutta sp. TaxID=1962930 RepID=UPI00322094C1